MMGFRYPASTLKFILVVSVAGVGVVSYAVIMVPGDFIERLAFWSLLAAFALILNLQMMTKEVRIDEAGITLRSLWLTRSIRWSDLTDFLCSSQLLILTGQGGRRISLFRGAYGFSVEPFEDLREKIIPTAREALTKKWERVTLGAGRAYPYPPFSPGQALAYGIPLLLAALFFGIAPLRAGIFGREQILFLSLAISLVAIPLVRDYRKTRKKLVVREDGVSQENGTRQVLLWGNIAQVLVKEAFFGYGDIVLIGKVAGRITIPRKMRGCGELLFLVIRRSRARIEQGFEW